MAAEIKVFPGFCSDSVQVSSDSSTDMPGPEGGGMASAERVDMGIFFVAQTGSLSLGENVYMYTYTYIPLEKARLRQVPIILYTYLYISLIEQSSILNLYIHRHRHIWWMEQSLTRC